MADTNSLMILSAQPLTMTSLELAELTGLRHDNVKRTIETLAERGVITLPQSEEVSNDGPGPKTISVYRVGKRDSYVIVAQLSPEFTARLVDRWQELENAAPRLPSHLETARMLVSSLERAEKAESALAIAGPKAKGFDRIASSDGSFCLTDAAKSLQVQPRRFMAKLQQMGWIYRRPMGSGWLAYQDRIAMGVMEHKVTTGDKSDGTEWTGTQVRVTAKGMARLSMIFNEGVLL